MNKRSKFLAGCFFMMSAASILSPLQLFAADVELLISLTGNEDMGSFRQPGGIFFDEYKKRLYIADTANSRLVSFDSEYDPIAEFDANGKLKLPSDVVRDRNGIFYLLAGRKKELTRIDLVNKEFEVLPVKNAPQRANPVLPGRLAIDSAGKLYITDNANSRILMLDRDGVCLGEIFFPGKKTSFSDIRVDSDGIIYALSTLARKVYIISRNGKLLKEFGGMGEAPGKFLFPVSLAVGKLKKIYVLDQHKGQVLVFEKDGKYLSDFSKKGALPGELFTPSHIFADKAGLIYIADRGNNRVQIFK